MNVLKSMTIAPFFTPFDDGVLESMVSVQIVMHETGNPCDVKIISFAVQAEVMSKHLRELADQIDSDVETFSKKMKAAYVSALADTEECEDVDDDTLATEHCQS